MNPSLVGGDFNARSPLWDGGAQEEDSYGRQVVEFLRETPMALLNELSGTVPTHNKGRVLDLLLADLNHLPMSQGAAPLSSGLGSDHRPLWCCFGAVARDNHCGRPAIAWSKATQVQWEDFRNSLVAANTTQRGTVVRRHVALVKTLLSAAEFFPRSFRSRPNRKTPRAIADALAAAAQAWSEGDEAEIRTAEAAVSSAAETASYFSKGRRSVWSVWRESVASSNNTPLDNFAAPRSQAKRFLQLFADKHRTRGAATAPVEVSTMDELFIPFSMVELRSALTRQRTTGAADPLGLAPIILQHLPEVILAALLALINASMERGELPRAWRWYEAVPIPKQAIALSCSLFRPVTLSALFCRIAERMVQVRLVRFIELDQHQHGFVAGMSPEVLLARFVHSVSETIRCSSRKGTATSRKDSRPLVSHVTLAVAFDFSDAFCSVTPHQYLRLLQARGVPAHLRRWLAVQLSDRRFRVRWRGRYSDFADAPCGFMQGTVGGPPGWNLVADGLSHRLVNTTPRILRGTTGIRLDFGWIADDLTVWCSGDDCGAVLSRLRLFCREVAQWAIELNLCLSPKTKGAYFARSAPQNVVLDFELDALDKDGTKIRLPVHFGATLKLLGVHLDSALTFGNHVQALLQDTAILQERFKVVAHYLHPEQMRQILIGCFVNRWLYGAPIWWPHLSSSDKEDLEIRLRALCRVAFGLIGTTPNGAVVAEARMLPLDAQVAKKAFRLACVIRRDTWLSQCLQLTPGTEKEPRKPGFVISFFRPLRNVPRLPLVPLRLPYTPEDCKNASRVRFFTKITGDITRTSAVEVRRAFNEAQLLLAPHQLLILSDGSLAGGKSGSASMFWRVCDTNSELIAVAHASAGEMASSFTAEHIAILGALERLEALAPTLCATIVDAMLGTDGLSALETLRLGPLNQKTILGVRVWQCILRLSARFSTLSFCFVFSHCGWTKGDSVDAEAKAALDRTDHGSVAVLAQDEARVSWGPTLVEANKNLRDKMGFRAELLAAQGEDDEPSLSLHLPVMRGVTRSDARLLAQLRTGCCGRLGGWRHERPESCPACGEIGAICRGGGAVKHLFSCPALQDLRDRFGIDDHTSLIKELVPASKYVRAALNRLGK